MLVTLAKKTGSAGRTAVESSLEAYIGNLTMVVDAWEEVLILTEVFNKQIYSFLGHTAVLRRGRWSEHWNRHTFFCQSAVGDGRFRLRAALADVRKGKTGAWA